MTVTINGSGTITGLSAGGLPDNSITTAEIADNAVTLAKMARSGTAGQVLTSGGAGADPTYANLPAGGVTSITGTASQITASASTGAVTLSLPSTINVNTSGASASCSGNAATATTLSSGQSNWSGTGVLGNVVGMLAWKNYSNNHVIFDASASTSPSGTAVNNTNAQSAWAGSYPTLMGWNGSSTYGVRVDSSRVADNGIGGTLTDRTGSRASNTSYTNSTGRPLVVYCSFNNTNGGATLYMNGSIIRYINGYGNGPGVTFIVPPGYTYQVNMNSAVNKWWEY